MPTIEAAGRTTAYVVDGAGPPLVLLHGATGSGADHFASLLPVVTAGFRAYAPDARGHGGTPWHGDEPWTTGDLVVDVLAFADALGLATFHLLGYSLGGMTALHLAAAAPDRLRTLVLVSISPLREPRLPVGRRLMDPDRIERDDPAWAARLAARHDPVQGPGGWQRLLRAVVADIEAQPLLSPRDLRRIDSPTLVVAGDRDPFVPVGQAHELARQVRDGRLLILPGGSHDAIDQQGPMLHAALADFYQRTETVARRRADDRQEDPAP